MANAIQKISLYIPSYNGAKYLPMCIRCVLRQTYPIDEVIVLDDGSEDETAAIVSKFQVKLVKHHHNKGIAGARNTAIMATRNDFVVSIDADCLIGPTWLEECMKNFINSRVAAVGGMLVERNNKKIADRWRAAHMKHHWGKKKSVNPGFLSGSNVVIRKEAFRHIGLYNEKRFRTNYEDVDLSLRLKENGFDLIYEPNAIAWHIREDTYGSLLRTYWGWRQYVWDRMFLRRLLFHLFRGIKLILDDILRGRFEFILLDILTFPSSIYFDLRKLARTATQKQAAL